MALTVVVGEHIVVSAVLFGLPLGCIHHGIFGQSFQKRIALGACHGLHSHEINCHKRFAVGKSLGRPTAFDAAWERDMLQFRHLRTSKESGFDTIDAVLGLPITGENGVEHPLGHTVKGATPYLIAVCFISRCSENAWILGCLHNFISDVAHTKRFVRHHCRHREKTSAKALCGVELGIGGIPMTGSAHPFGVDGGGCVAVEHIKMASHRLHKSFGIDIANIGREHHLL